MRIALQNTFPGRLVAEKEFINRALEALRNLGWEGAEVATAAEIRRFDPDCVLVTHQRSPKLTSVPTIGLMWNPLRTTGLAPGWSPNILSYDGYLPGSKEIARWLEDHLFSTRKNAPIADFLFLPSCYRTTFPTEAPRERSLFYAGIHWDGRRHGSLFRRLNTRIPLAVYGPPESWKGFGASYRGTIPFDGHSFLAEIRGCGAALCIHRPEHRQDDVPSMRLFEAAASGAVIITDRMSYTERHFADSVLYIDLDGPLDRVVAQIEAHMDFLSKNPEVARTLASRAHSILCSRLSLEKQFEGLPHFLERVRQAGHFSHAASPAPPRVQYIVRHDRQSIDDLARSLASLQQQTHRNLEIILATANSCRALDDTVATFRRQSVSIRVLPPSSELPQVSSAGLERRDGAIFCNWRCGTNDCTQSCGVRAGTPDRRPPTRSGFLRRHRYGGRSESD